MDVGSLFSGIGGMDAGLARAGFTHVFFCESDEWRRSVLAHHWPGVPIFDDVRDVGVVAGSGAQWGGSDAVGRRGGTSETATAELRPVLRDKPDAVNGAPTLDLLCGGFPCQDLSVAGNRAGLAGSRSGLFFEFARIIDALRPRWVLIENVPGLLSSNGGRDFGIVLGTLADLGYGVGWRIVDSRFFGVPQRRRRVFIVGALADGDTRAAAERAGEVLAVGTRCPGHPATGAEARENAAVASLSGLGSGGPDDNDAQGGRVIAFAGHGEGEAQVANALKVPSHGASWSGGSSDTFIAAPLSHGSNPNSNMAGRRREDDENLVPFDAEQSYQEPDELAYLTRKLRRSIAGAGQAVRRLTPTECERLQALPDGWTNHGPDSRRYSALGDAVTASVSEWIGRRLMHGC